MAVKHYVDEIPPSSGRVYQITTNGSTSSIVDVTAYQQEGSGFGASDVNATCVLECTYVKNNNTHQLITQNTTSENIKFFATTDYKRGDKFTFNGVAVDAKTVDGFALDNGFFKANSIVQCNMRNGVLYFMGRSRAVVDDTDPTNQFQIGMADGLVYLDDGEEA